MTIKIITLFLIANLINTMLSTIKSIVTARSDNKLTVSMVNAITYGFYAIIVKQLANLPLEYTIAITIVANLIGVSSSMAILEKVRKERLWKISATGQEEDKTAITQQLEESGLAYALNKVYHKEKKYFNIDIYSENKQDSRKLKSILNQFEIKYHYSEVKNRL